MKAQFFTDVGDVTGHVDLSGIDVMKFIPSNDSMDGSLINRWDDDHVRFILKDDSKIEDAVKQGGRHESTYAHSQADTVRGETVADALARHDLTLDSLLRIEVRRRSHDSTSGREYYHVDSTWWFIPDGDDLKSRNADEMLAVAARDLASKKIGFSEFKRIVRENS